MIVKIVDAPITRGGGKAVVLCDDDGVMLPMQFHTSVENGAGERPTVTASFYIDGKKVRFE